MKFIGVPTYIETYKNVLTHSECETIIKYFEQQPKVEGVIGISQDKSDKTRKSCLELPGLAFSNIKYELISNIIFPVICQCLEKYKKKYKELDLLQRWNICNNYNIQKYSTLNDGYKIWHCEQGMENETSGRILSWMFYLNNSKSGTEFLRYSNIKPKAGNFIIWPAGWTHMHKGETPNKGLKYIITGWVEYDKLSNCLSR